MINKIIRITKTPFYWIDRQLAERFETDFVLEESDVWGAVFLAITIGGLMLARAVYFLMTGN